MKKFFSLLLAIMLLFAVACAETATEAEDMRAFYNPENYTLLRVTDAFLMDDGAYVVQGRFGDIDLTDDTNPVWLGFDKDFVCTLAIAPDAVIEMPESIYSIEDNVPATHDDVIAFVEAMREDTGNVDFYCEFEMNEDGVLTMLAYCFYPY